MTGHSFAAQPGCSALCVCGEWDHHPVHGPNFDRLYLDLKSALERSAVCPGAWSKHDQPEYPEATS